MRRRYGGPGIEELFTRVFLAAGGAERASSPSRERHRQRAVWQRRFWEQTCHDEGDLLRCVDYLDCNPVNHGLCARAGEHPWSTC